MMKGSDLRNEKEEFKDLVKVWQDKYTTLRSSSVNSHKDKVEISQRKWFPDRLLMLRFGVEEQENTSDNEIRKPNNKRKIETGDDYFV
jgi:hypothetical protein